MIELPPCGMVKSSVRPSGAKRGAKVMPEKLPKSASRPVSMSRT